MMLTPNAHLRRLVPICWALTAMVFAGCSESRLLIDGSKMVTRDDELTAGGTYKVGKPYQVKGVWYYPAADYNYNETGVASWYGPGFHANQTANGETYDENALTAAHKTLPMPSLVRVTNLENGRAVVLRVNDRGPFANGRIIDVTRRAAQLLGFVNQGTAKVRVQILEDESRMLAAKYQQNGAPIAKGPNLPPVPVGDVAAETLPPPGGVTVAPPQPTWPTTPRPTNGTVLAQGPTGNLIPDGQVAQTPVKPTAYYVQAGAFADQSNAHRLSTQLSTLGPTRITPVTVNGQTLYRVRVGPIASLDEADAMLARLVDGGQPQARLIVE